MYILKNEYNLRENIVDMEEGSHASLEISPLLNLGCLFIGRWRNSPQVSSEFIVRTRTMHGFLRKSRNNVKVTPQEVCKIFYSWVQMEHSSRIPGSSKCLGSISLAAISQLLAFSVSWFMLSCLFYFLLTWPLLSYITSLYTISFQSLFLCCSLYMSPFAFKIFSLKS